MMNLSEALTPSIKIHYQEYRQINLTGFMVTVCLRSREERSQTHIFPVNFLLCRHDAPETLYKCTLKPWQWLINSIYLNLLSLRSQSIPFSCTHHFPKSMPWNICLMSAVTGQFMKPLLPGFLSGLMDLLPLHKAEMSFPDG